VLRTPGRREILGVIDWEGIVRDEGPAVWRTAQRLLGNRADADECFQETFAAAVEWARKTSQPVRNWRALLVRVATARAVNRLRQRVRRTSRETGDGDVAALPDRNVDSRPAERAQQAEMSARLREALAHLPPKQADAFCLHCLEGWSYREVAEHLDESVDNVGVLVHRARAALKERIASILSGTNVGGAAAEATGVRSARGGP
jgi:RNA polymerase sigma-70 factor (ECF subfamily)